MEKGVKFIITTKGGKSFLTGPNGRDEHGRTRPAWSSDVDKAVLFDSRTEALMAARGYHFVAGRALGAVY